MNQQHQERQNKSLPPSLFKTATYMNQTNKQAKEKTFHKTQQSQFKPSQLYWNQSSTSLTRDKAPSHCIPKAERFNTVFQEKPHKAQSTLIQFLKSQTSKGKDNIENKQRGVSFAKSQRPEHFVRVNSLNPSPTDYSQQRFMNQTNYKTFRSKSKTEASFQTQQDIKLMKIRGIKFCRFENYHKNFLDHTKHRPYQPEDTIRNPGPGLYKLSFANKKREARFSFIKAMNRFNGNKQLKPGPGAYHQETERVLSFNSKGTFPKSTRVFLNKFQSNPAPNQYEIPRFLSTKNKQ